MAAPMRPISTPPQWFCVAMVWLCALVLPVGYLGNQGEALVVAIGGGLSLPFVLRARRPALGVALVAALAVWACVSFAWSPLEGRLFAIHRYGDVEALTAPKLLLQALLYTGFVYGALRLPPDQRDRALRFAAVSAVVTLAMLLIEAAEGGMIYGLLNSSHGHPLRADLAKRDAARGCYGMALLFWPLAVASWGRVPAAVPIGVAVGTAGSALMLGVDAPAAALLLSALVFVGVRASPRLGAWACLVVVALHFLVAPLVFLTHGHAAAAADLPDGVGKESWHVRIGIWRFASNLIAHRPLLGYGLDASRVYPDHIPMHPHDAALQLWLETGVLGALLAALFWGWLFYRIREAGRQDATWTATACATASAYLLVGAISFGVWQEWWLGLGAVAIAWCAMLLNMRRQEAAVQETQTGGLAALS
jgi:O-antigen ligase